jgi:triosephosphate isomerase (TIM)
MRTIIANWKMNPETLQEAKQIWSGTKRVSAQLKRTQIIVCPPALFAPNFTKGQHKKLQVGLQDIFHETKGSYTGQLSPTMARDMDINATIVGHSERRKLGETNELIHKKVMTALNQGMTVVLCIGETYRDNDGAYLNVIREQLMIALANIQRSSLSKLQVAYEPVWAIGATEPMTATDIHGMTIFIKKTLGELFSKDLARTIPILYGGSVFADNAREIVEKGGVQGLLVGRESLTISFIDLIKAVDAIK